MAVRIWHSVRQLLRHRDNQFEDQVRAAFGIGIDELGKLWNSLERVDRDIAGVRDALQGAQRETAISNELSGVSNRVERIADETRGVRLALDHLRRETRSSGDTRELEMKDLRELVRQQNTSTLERTAHLEWCLREWLRVELGRHAQAWNSLHTGLANELYSCIDQKVTAVSALLATREADTFTRIEQLERVHKQILCAQDAAGEQYVAQRTELQRIERLATGVAERAGTIAEELSAMQLRVDGDVANLSKRVSDELERVDKQMLCAQDAVGEQHAGLRTELQRLEQIATGLSERVGTTAEDVGRLCKRVSEELERMDKQLFCAQDVVQEQYSGLRAELQRLAEQQLALFRELQIPRVVPMGADMVATFTEFGWAVLPNEDYAAVLQVAAGDLFRNHEPGTRKVATTLARPGDTVIDAGAHVGLFAIPMARRVGPSGRVLAVEPLPRAMQCLRIALNVNGLTDRVELHNSATWCREARLPFFLGTNTMMGTLIGEGSGLTIRVKAERLDHIVEPGTSVALVKMDVEGAESATFRGMKRIIRDNPELVIIAEFGPSHLQRAGIAVEDWLKAFQKKGLSTILEIDESHGNCRPLRSLEELQQVYSLNLVLSRRPLTAFTPVLAQDYAQ